MAASEKLQEVTSLRRYYDELIDQRRHHLHSLKCIEAAIEDVRKRLAQLGATP
jgi:hypothetical protein